MGEYELEQVLLLAAQHPMRPGGMNVGNTVSHTCQSHKAGGFLKLALEGKRCLMEQLCRSYANREHK